MSTRKDPRESRRISHNSVRTLKRHRRSQPIQGYEIRVVGHLEETFFEWFGAVSILNQENGDALISGSIPDQAALMRILLQLHDLGFVILSVKALKRRR